MVLCGHSSAVDSIVNVSQISKVNEILNPIGFRQWVVQRRMTIKIIWMDKEVNK